MEQYKTVKEVCALTGLTGKHLYYFHHENVVRAVAYANYSVEGNDGYKLYDEAAVEKLRQIALYYQIGLKRNEIRDIMLDPGYDSNRVLETLLERKLAEKDRIDRQIAALNYLKKTGVKNGFAGVLKGKTLEELGRELIGRNGRQEKAFPDGTQMEAFFQELAALLTKLGSLTDSAVQSPPGVEIVRDILALGKRYFGADGCPLIVGLLAGAIGEGELAGRLPCPISPQQSRAVIRCIADHPELQTTPAETYAGV